MQKPLSIFRQALWKKTLPALNFMHAPVKHLFFFLQGQFVLETYFVMILYGMITFGMILLTEAAEVTSETNNGGNNDVGKRKWLAIAGLAMVAFFFSLLLSVFRSKAGGYPYSFLIK